jgi:DNA polymerase I
MHPAPDLAATAAEQASHALLYGRDPTPGIVSVAAGRDGRVWVWRRVDGGVVCEEDRFPNWFLLADRSLLAAQPCVELLPGELDAARQLRPGEVGLVELRGDLHYRYLVLGYGLAAVEQAVVAAYHARTGEQARGLYDLRDVVYARSPVEQYLIGTGRTYYKGLGYHDLRRLQFDLETTGLNRFADQIFLIAMRGSDGWEAVLDLAELGDEAALLRRFVELVREYDPDVIENHNLFDFDVPFLVERARRLRVPLPLGRDGGEFTRYEDTLKVGEKSERFTRWCLAGRELVDTLHAVRRYGAIVRDLRNHTLKEAARHFGLADTTREYLDGAAIWPVYQREPERVRRYALDDVREVDRLSQLLLAPSFALAAMVPRPFERVATAGTGQGLIEPLLVRAYVTAGHSLPRAPGVGGTYEGAHTELFRTGILRHIVKADVASLYPSIMLTYTIQPRSDRLGAFLALLRELTRLRLHHKAAARRLARAAAPEAAAQRAHHDAVQAAMKVLINSFYGAMGTSFALFGDLEAAAEVTRRGREILKQMLAALERRGVTLIEADTDGVLFSVPEDWTEEQERQLVAEVAAELPEGIQVEYDGRWERMYSHAAKNYVLRGYDGRLRTVGASFRSSRNEPYGERFLQQAIERILADDLQGLRALYRELVGKLRRREVPVEDLCVTMPLSKTPAQYQAAKRREEAYEVLLAAGRTTWKPGERVRYYQAVGGKKKLAELFADDYDPEPYVKKLRTTYAQRLVAALGSEQLQALFADPEAEARAAQAAHQPSLFD